MNKANEDDVKKIIDEYVRVKAWANATKRKTPIDKLSNRFMNQHKLCLEELAYQAINVDETGTKDKVRQNNGERLISTLEWGKTDENGSVILHERFSPGEMLVLKAVMSEYAQTGGEQPYITQTSHTVIH